MRYDRAITDRIRIVLSVTKQADATLLAAAIAFYALLSIIPLGVVILAVAAMIGGERVIDPLISSFEHLVTEETIAFVQTGLEEEAGRSGATIGGILVASWGSLKVFRGLDMAFNTIYGEPGTASIVESLRNGLAVFVAIAGIAATLGIALFALSAIGVTLSGIALPLLMMPLVSVVLWPMYAMFPPGGIMIRTSIPGAIFAGIGITIATMALNVYIAIATPFAVYGVLAGVFIAMTWLYVIALVLLLGGVINATEVGTHRQLHAPAGS